MKKILFFILALSLLGCEKIIDEKRELNNIDNDLIWQSEELANLFLNKAYASALPGFKMTSNTSISDEATGSGTANMMFGMLTKEDSYGNFLAYWNNIRRVNMILEESQDNSLNPEFIKQLRGQAYFLRAWMYWEMVKYYGGVPLVTEVIDIQDTEKHMVSRAPASECVAQITQDLDSAIIMLPDRWPSTDYGRITRAAASALKGRVLLFYASPQFNPDNDRQRWNDAYSANLAAKELAEEDGYALNENFERIFLDEDDANEALFVVRFDDNSKYHTFEDNVRPRSVSSSNNTVSSTPNWEFVESFPMKDGFAPGESPNYTYDKNTFWLNRDPRLDATVAYNGMKWNFADIDGRRFQWTFTGNKVDEGEKASLTGFYLKKNINTAILRLNTYKTPTDWIEIRLAEVYLNLAECAAETGENAEAIELIGMLRNRAGIENTDGKYGINTDNLVEAALLERKIELSFEDKRHWDLRRRNMFINDLGNTPMLNGTKRHGIAVSIDTAYIFSLDLGIQYRYDTIVANNQTFVFIANPDTAISHFLNIIVDTIADLSLVHDDYFNIEFNIEMDVGSINFLQPEYNFYFVPETEMEKNLNLRQTIYWTTVDPFNPLIN